MGEGRRRVLIVGGLGYFGARLASALGVESDVTVTSRSLSADRRRWLEKNEGSIKSVHFDSAAQQNLPVDGKFDCIVNLALPGAAEVSRDRDSSREQALRTVRACLSLLKSGGATRLIHFSTFHVYGAHRQALFSEEDVTRPTHPYGELHQQCEQLLTAESDGQPVFIVRPTNIVGAPAHGDLGPQGALVFLDLCRQAMQERQLSLRSNGRAYRDFVTMSDAINSVTLLLSLARHAAAPGAFVMNLASGTALPLDELARKIQAEAEGLTGESIAVNFGVNLDSLSEPFQVTNERLHALGWQPLNGMGDEIRQTLEFFRPA